MPTESSPVNSLVERMKALADAASDSVGTRTPQDAHRLMARCQRCRPFWDIGHGCSRMDRREWVTLLITPGRSCNRMPPAL